MQNVAEESFSGRDSAPFMLSVKEELQNPLGYLFTELMRANYPFQDVSFPNSYCPRLLIWTIFKTLRNSKVMQLFYFDVTGRDC